MFIEIYFTVSEKPACSSIEEGMKKCIEMYFYLYIAAFKFFTETNLPLENLIPREWVLVLTNNLGWKFNQTTNRVNQWA